MKEYLYVGMDVHKKVIAVCVKEVAGTLISRQKIPANRKALKDWVGSIEKPWIGAMESTIFSAWIFDFLKPYAHDLFMAHPQMLKAITAAKKKNDAGDAEKIADLLRCDLLPKCWVAPPEIRELRKALRFRNLMVSQATRMLNKMNGLMLECGVEYETKKLAGKKYFAKFTDELESLDYVPESVIEMMQCSRAAYDLFHQMQKKIQSALVEHPQIKRRVERLMQVPGIGEVMALTWVLEIGEPQRFSSVNKAVSYCGLCSEQNESAGKDKRGPLSKKRNKHLQTKLIEIAKLAPMHNEVFAQMYKREKERGSNHNQASIAIARRIVALLLVLDKKEEDYDAEIHGAAFVQKSAV